MAHDNVVRLSISELARRHGVSRQTARRRVKRGQLSLLEPAENVLADQPVATHGQVDGQVATLSS